MTQGSTELQMLGDMKGELGELRGQMREIIHNQNNMHQKIDGLWDKVSAHQSLAREVQEHDQRITALERSENRRDGALSFGDKLMKSPLVGWLLGGGLALWALLSGKGPQ